MILYIFKIQDVSAFSLHNAIYKIVVHKSKYN